MYVRTRTIPYIAHSSSIEQLPSMVQSSHGMKSVGMPRPIECEVVPIANREDGVTLLSL